MFYILSTVFSLIASTVLGLSLSSQTLHGPRSFERESSDRISSTSLSLATGSSMTQAGSYNFSVDDLLSKGIQALGGQQALSAVDGISFSA